LEMAQLRQALAELAAKLDRAGVTFHEITKNLATGGATLETAAGALNLAMNNLEATMLEASNTGKRGADFVNEALDKTTLTIQSLGSISGGLVNAASSLQSVGGKMSEIVDNVEELSREQRSVVAAVREVAPKAQAAVERVAGILEVAGKQTKESIEATAATLGKTVASMTEGVTSYTNQVADLHRKMDGHLAKAVSSFDKGVNELAESVEELADIMQKSKRA
jgi:methyl-accepting chemotaxis protein